MALALGWVCAAAWPAAAVQAEVGREFAVIVSPDVGIERVSVADVRRMFMLDRRFWKAGQGVITLMPASGTRTRQFLLRRVCGTDESQFRKMVLERMYRGELDLAPKVVGSDEDAASFVAASRGLIAIVPAPLAAAAHARVLLVGGKAPGAAGYPLKD